MSTKCKLVCQVCRSDDVTWDAVYKVWVCGNCGHRWYDNQSYKSKFKYGYSFNGEDYTAVETTVNDDEMNSRENSEADGLMSLGEEDILFPPE